MFSPDGPFHRTDALASGVTDAQLRSRRYVRLFHGVYMLATAQLSLTVWLRAALLVLPPDAVASHVTALRLYGLDLGPPWPLHVSTRSRTHSRQKNLAVHQRRAPISSVLIDGIPVTSPNRTLVDIATKVSLVQLVAAAELMIHEGMTTLDSLTTYALERHLDGVRRVRRVLGLIRSNVESPRETALRLAIVFARLPEPRCNLNILDPTGGFIARGDLVYERWRVVVEYDGWYHERSAAQRQRDIFRRERLEAEGWRVIVVTSTDMERPRDVIHRIHAALKARGYEGRPPVFSVTWTHWFD